MRHANRACSPKRDTLTTQKKERKRKAGLLLKIALHSRSVPILPKCTTTNTLAHWTTTICRSNQVSRTDLYVENITASRIRVATVKSEARLPLSLHSHFSFPLFTHYRTFISTPPVSEKIHSNWRFTSSYIRHKPRRTNSVNHKLRDTSLPTLNQNAL